VPAGHLLRSVDRFVELDGLRRELAPFYSEVGRPSIDPELMIRMLIIGYCRGIRSERRCIVEGLVGGEGFAVDASLIEADANRQSSVPGSEWSAPETVSHAVREYLAVLDDAAFGAATAVVPEFISHADPASRWTGANGGLAFFAYCTNYLIDLKCAVIVDVEATTAVRQAEVTAQRRMIERTQERFGLWPERLAADTGYGSAENLAWLVHERGIEPHIPVAAHPGGRTSRCSTNPGAPTAPSRETTLSMTTNATATSALPAGNSGSGKRSIGCRVLSSTRTA
jgi:hypothetical protein